MFPRAVWPIPTYGVAGVSDSGWEAVGARVREGQRRITRLAGWVAERDVFLARGALFGAFVLCVAFLLAVVASG